MALQNLQTFLLKKSQILSCDTVVANERYIYIVSSHKLWYMLLDTVFLFFYRVRRVLGSASNNII